MSEENAEDTGPAADDALTSLEEQVAVLSGQLSEMRTAMQAQAAQHARQTSLLLEKLAEISSKTPPNTPPTPPPIPPRPLSVDVDRTSVKSDASYFQERDANGRDRAGRDLPSVEPDPHLPKSGSASGRRTTILYIGSYEIEQDETIEPISSGQVNLTQVKPPHITVKQLSSAADLVRFKDAYVSYFITMSRFKQNPQSIRELMGPRCLKVFNNLYLHLSDANGVPDATEVTDDKILRAIDANRRSATEEKAKDLLPSLRERLRNIWIKGPTAKRPIKVIVNEVFTIVSEHIDDYGRMDLYQCPDTLPKEEQERFKTERKQIVTAVWNVFPKHLRETVRREMGTDEANGYQADPRKVLKWLQAHLPRFYHVYAAGAESSLTNSNNPSDTDTDTDLSDIDAANDSSSSSDADTDSRYSSDANPDAENLAETEEQTACAQTLDQIKEKQQASQKRLAAKKSMVNTSPANTLPSNSSPPPAKEQQAAPPLPSPAFVPLMSQTQVQPWHTHQWIPPTPRTQMAPDYAMLPAQASMVYNTMGGPQPSYTMQPPASPSPYGYNSMGGPQPRYTMQPPASPSPYELRRV